MRILDMCTANAVVFVGLAITASSLAVHTPSPSYSFGVQSTPQISSFSTGAISLRLSATSPAAATTSLTLARRKKHGDSDDHESKTDVGETDAGETDAGEAAEEGENYEQVREYDIVHGVLMGVTVVLLFPFAAIWMRLGGSMIVHAAIQMLGIVCILAGLAVGYKLAKWKEYLFEHEGRLHTLFGIILIGLFLLQPVLGVWHHIQYRRTQSRALVSHAHIWYGRTLMVCAVVNGGLGLKLASNSRSGEIAYAVLAAVMGGLYMVSVLLRRKGKAKKPSRVPRRRKDVRATTSEEEDRKPHSERDVHDR